MKSIRFSKARKGVGVLQILPNLVLMVGIIAGILYAINQGTPTEIVDSAISGLMSPFLLLIEKIFAVIGPVSPVLLALIPAYLVFRDEGAASLQHLYWSTGYGLALFILVVVSGIDVRVMAGIQTGWSGSIVDEVLGYSFSVGRAMLGFFLGCSCLFAGLLFEGFQTVCSKLTEGKGLQTVGMILVIWGIASSGLFVYQNGLPGVAATIYADETPPSINLDASTHGKIAYPVNGKPVLLCFVDENMEMDTVYAEIKTKGGLLGLGSETIDQIELDSDGKTGTIHKYRGTSTKSLVENVEYRLLYTATNQVGFKDIEETRIELVELAGTVSVNGVEVKSPSQTIYTTDLTLFIEAKITQGSTSLTELALCLNGDRLQSFESASGGSWVTTYQLPADGEYSFIVEALAHGGQSIQLASFGVTNGSTLDPWVLIGVGVAGVGVLGALIYWDKEDSSP